MILPITYRLWAKARLDDLGPWIDLWKTPETFAGTDSNGAEDACYLTTLAFEEAALKGEDVTGGAANIFKRFDQILRDLLVQLLAIGGMPKGITSAYARYMDGLMVRNAVANSIGAPYQLPTGIPQGCPLSMTLVAFLLRPWIVHLERSAHLGR